MPQLLPDRPQPFPNLGTSGLHVIRHESAAGAESLIKRLDAKEDIKKQDGFPERAGRRRLWLESTSSSFASLDCKRMAKMQALR